MKEAPELNLQARDPEGISRRNQVKDLASFDLSGVSRYQYLFLAAFTILAFLIRFYKLGEWSLWIDEIFTLNRAQAHYASFESMLRNIPPRTNWVPVSLLATSTVINTLGISEWTARLVPAVIGVLSIPILYFPTRKVFGTGVALISVLLLAISPWHVSWS
jgi:mannosyltransferase